MNQVTGERLIDMINTYRDKGKLEAFIRDAARGYSHNYGGDRIQNYENTEMRFRRAVEEYDWMRVRGQTGLSQDVGEELADILVTAGLGRDHARTDENINYVIDMALGALPGGGYMKTAKKGLGSVVNRQNLEKLRNRGGLTGKIAGYGADAIGGLKNFLDRRDPRLKWGTALTGIAAAMGYTYGHLPAALYNSLFTYGEGDERKDIEDGSPNSDKAVDAEYEKETLEELKEAFGPLYKKVLAAKFNKMRNYEDELNRLLNNNVPLSNDQFESYVIRELKRVYVQIREERSYNPRDYSPISDLDFTYFNRYNSIVY